VQWKSVLVAAALVLGAATTTTPMAFGRGMAGGAHFAGGAFAGHGFAGHGFADHGFAVRHGFVRSFRRNFAFRNGFAFRKNFANGGWWWPYYDDFPTDAYGDAGTTIDPETAGFAPDAVPAPVCHRSEETVRVPAEGGGTSQIKIIRCP
jgi:hypothetical protein